MERPHSLAEEKATASPALRVGAKLSNRARPPRPATGLQTPADFRPSLPSSPSPNEKGSWGLGLLKKNAGTHAGFVLSAQS